MTAARKVEHSGGRIVSQRMTAAQAKALVAKPRAARKPPAGASNIAELMALHISLELAIPEPEREYRFHQTRLWRCDFAWPEHRWALEVEGGIWTNGAHTRGKHFESDCAKYAELALAGYRLLRVTGDQIRRGEAIEWLRRAFGLTA